MTKQYTVVPANQLEGFLKEQGFGEQFKAYAWFVAANLNNPEDEMRLGKMAVAVTTRHPEKGITHLALSSVVEGVKSGSLLFCDPSDAGDGPSGQKVKALEQGSNRLTSKPVLKDFKHAFRVMAFEAGQSFTHPVTMHAVNAKIMSITG